MSVERVFNVILLEYTTEKIKVEATIEELVASSLSNEFNVKVDKLKHQIERLSKIDDGIKKITEMITILNNEEK
jgi:hypothetical protein